AISSARGKGIVTSSCQSPGVHSTWNSRRSSRRMADMPPPFQTVRQRIVELLTGSRLSSYELAQRLGIPERQVEDHLVHVVKTVGRNCDKRIILEPASRQHGRYSVVSR